MSDKGIERCERIADFYMAAPKLYAACVAAIEGMRATLACGAQSADESRVATEALKMCVAAVASASVKKGDGGK